MAGPAESEFQRLRRAGVTLPREPIRGRLAAQGISQRVADTGSMARDVQSVLTSPSRSRLDTFHMPLDPRRPRWGSDDEAKVVEEMGHRRRTAFSGSLSSDAQIAWPKYRDPFDYWKDRAEWYKPNGKDEEFEKLRLWARLLYATHHLLPSLIDIYSRFPLLEMEFSYKDPKLADWFSDLFLNELHYQEFLFDMSREYWTTGECFALGSWHDGIGAWEADDIINPDDVVVTKNPLLRAYDFHIKVPGEIRNLIETQQPRAEYIALMDLYPDVVAWAREDKDIPVSDVLMKQLKFKTNPWSNHGTPIMLRGFRQLMLEESLFAAQDAVADRMYSPLILARVGLDNVDDTGPWIPDGAQLDQVRNDLNLALSSDFRLMVYHHGLDIQNVFGRDRMPDLSKDFDRIDVAIMGLFGIGADLMRGGVSSTYASGALNKELVTQMLETHQVGVRQFMRDRMEPISERQAFYEYEKKGDRRIPVMETVLVYDEETGKEYIEERPKLAIPDVSFKTVSMRDDKTEREFLKTLKDLGWPISLQSMAVNIPIEFDKELETSKEEKLKLVIEEQEYKKQLFQRLRARGLPIPIEYKAEYEAWTQGTGEADATALSGPMGDLSSGPPTPNLAPNPDTGDVPPGATPGPDKPGLAEAAGFEGATAADPRQRPAISDEQRATMPRQASVERQSILGESVIDGDIAREVLANLSEATVNEPVQYGGMMRMSTPSEMRKRRKMRIMPGMRVTPPDEMVRFDEGRFREELDREEERLAALEDDVEPDADSE